MAVIKIWCLLIDHEKKAAYGNVFGVTVPADADIDDLTKKVKEERPDVLEHVVPGRLTVWRCTDSGIDFADIDSDKFNDRLNEVFSPNEQKVKKLKPKQELRQLTEKTLLIEIPDTLPCPSVSNELRHPVSAESPRLRGDTAQEVEGYAYDFIQEQDKAVKTSAQALAESATESLEVFLQTTTLPLRDVVPTSSTHAHEYDTVRASILEKDVPFSAIKFNKMASSMVDNLFTQVLPAKPIKNIAPLSRARELARNYEAIARSSLDHEPAVWRGTHNILDTCIACLKAVGLMFKMDPEKLNKHANVKIDSVVVSITTGAGLAVEDKSPKVFEEHCTEKNIDALCGDGFLRLQDTEHGFRAIFFKLTIYMVKERLRWGLINCGTHMRIVRIEYEKGRPYVIISEEILPHFPAPSSVYSLICYMLLTCDCEVPIFDGIRDLVQEPPPLTNPDRAGVQTRQGVEARKITLVPPGDVTSMVLHTTAAAGRIHVDIPMMRIDAPPTILSNTRIADVYVVGFLDAGTFGRTFLSELFVHDLCYGQVVVKVANADLEEHLDTEALAYSKLRGLYGDGIPRYYGIFEGENAGIRYRCILIDFCGDHVKRIENLPLFQRSAMPFQQAAYHTDVFIRLEIFRILFMIHQRGVMHNDFSPMNILQTKSGVRLIDFSIAMIDHECSGMEFCRELIDAATKLRLTPLHTLFVSLWSLWVDVHDFIMHMQHSIIIVSVLLVSLVISAFQFSHWTTINV
ncbi:hypothetical protein ACEPAF_8731 [Sanghuangporus sanghuang]